MSSTQLILMAPVDGVVVPLADVPDPVFAEGTLGDGVALDPLEASLVAPCDGEIVQCARTAHAVTLRSDSGVELLIHLGLDTVNLDGAGIALRVATGQRVRAGEPLLTFDADRLAQGAMSLITPRGVADGAGWQIADRASERAGQRVRRGEPLLILERADVAQPVATPHAESPVQAGPVQESPARERTVTLALAARCCPCSFEYS